MNDFIKTQLSFPQSIYNKPKWSKVIYLLSWLPDNVRVLDIGFGYPFLPELTHGRLAVYGMDKSESSIKGLDNSYKWGDIEKEIPFEDDMFDAVIMLELIEHITEVDTMFKEILRVLRPGGKVIISTPNYEPPYNLFWAIMGATFYRWAAKEDVEAQHINRYSPQSLLSDCSRYSPCTIKTFAGGLGLIAILDSCHNEKQGE